MGSIPDEIIGFFNWPNPFSCTMVPGSIQPLIKMSTWNLPGVKGCHRQVIPESTVYKTRKPRRLTIIRVDMAPPQTFLIMNCQMNNKPILSGTVKVQERIAWVQYIIRRNRLHFKSVRISKCFKSSIYSITSSASSRLLPITRTYLISHYLSNSIRFRLWIFICNVLLSTTIYWIKFIV
jgi:hypothetical protein